MVGTDCYVMCYVLFLSLNFIVKMSVASIIATPVEYFCRNNIGCQIIYLFHGFEIRFYYSGVSNWHAICYTMSTMHYSHVFWTLRQIV